MLTTWRRCPSRTTAVSVLIARRGGFDCGVRTGATGPSIKGRRGTTGAPCGASPPARAAPVDQGPAGGGDGLSRNPEPPLGETCSRCGRPWAAATGPGYCSRCDGGAEWDDADRERRLRRQATHDLRMFVNGLAKRQSGRDQDLAIIRDELHHREIH